MMCPNIAQQQAGTRRRDKEESEEERPGKVRVTTTRPSSIWLPDLRSADFAVRRYREHFDPAVQLVIVGIT
jgi:hypothetical protein